MPVLHAVEGPLRGQKFHIPDKPKLIVGRYEVYDVIVPDPSISRKHFAFEQRPDGLYLIDLGSLNGTQLNGLRVSTAKIEHGDRITAGQTVLLFDEADSSAAPIVTRPAAGGDDQVEVISEEDILEDGPIALDVSEAIPETDSSSAPNPAGGVTPVIEEADIVDLGRRVTARLEAAEMPAGRGSKRRRAARGADACAACGREVTTEESQAGEGAQTRLGYVCGRCVEQRQRAGHRGSLEAFIQEKKRKRRS